MPGQIIAANWKMNKSITDARAFLSGLTNAVAGNAALGTANQLVILPQAASLFLAAEFPSGGKIHFGAQHIYWEEKGAFTGELSAVLAKELGATYCLAGHSERRQLFGETNESAVKRALAGRRLGLRPILCIGESLAEREGGKTESVLQAQLAPLFAAEKALLADLVIAYEPVWAIGTGLTATMDKIDAAHAFIAREFGKHWGAEDKIPILYGGSVKPENAKEILHRPKVGGLLIGGASLELDSYLKIAASAL